MLQNLKLSLLFVLLGGVLFTLIFHRQSLGLNLFLVELVMLSLSFATRQYPLRGRLAFTALTALVVTNVFCLVVHSVFVYVMNFIALGLFMGVMLHPRVKSYWTAIALAALNIMEAQVKFFQTLMALKVKGRGIGGFLRKSRIFSIPILIVLLFLMIYSQSNAVFEGLLGDFGKWISTHIAKLFQNFDALVILTFLLGLAVWNLFFFKVVAKPVAAYDEASSDVLARRRQIVNRNFHANSLKNEYKAGIFLFATLNALLLLVNVIDINWVWFHFDWEAQDLKQFVHEGTYLLILSILLSVALVLYFFRHTLNFYPRNKALKFLSLAWILQNGILTISVAIRNFIYIDHFALAYKRIGVIIFLLLTLYGLYTVFAKVFDRKSAFYLLRTNAYSIFVILTLSSLVNWDVVIARYNFSHAEKSWLHLQFLSELSDKALPDLERPLSELQRLDAIQDSLFPFSKDYMLPEAYLYAIETRKQSFQRAWEAKSIWEWNWAESEAFDRMSGHP